MEVDGQLISREEERIFLAVHKPKGIVCTADPREKDNLIDFLHFPKKITYLGRLDKDSTGLILMTNDGEINNRMMRARNHHEKEYQVTALPVNCEQLREEDIHRIMENVLFAFPVTEVKFFLPKWVEILTADHKVREELVSYAREVMGRIGEIRDAMEIRKPEQSTYINAVNVTGVSMDTGEISVEIKVEDGCYYEMLSDLTGTQISGEYDLIHTVRNLAMLQKEYESVKDALASVKMKGYGVVSATREEIRLDDPVVIRQGNKYGVKIRSEAPSIHMIRANIETEIAPIVGSEQQAKDLVNYINEAAKSPDGVWGTNIFGKSIEELVMDGVRNKIAMIGDESQAKLQDTMQKIVNDSNGGMVCIII